LEKAEKDTDLTIPIIVDIHFFSKAQFCHDFFQVFPLKLVIGLHHTQFERTKIVSHLFTPFHEVKILIG
jgi:hypothetical protein